VGLVLLIPSLVKNTTRRLSRTTAD